MENKLLGTVIGVVLGVILLGSMLMPVLDDVTATERTFENDHSYYVVENPATADIEWDGTTLTIDGETVATPATTDNPYGVSVFSKVDGVIRYNTNNTVQKWGAVGSYNSAVVTKMDLSIADGYLTGTYTYGSGDSATTSSVNIELTGDYYVLSNSTESEDVLTVSDGDLYLNGDTFVRSNGVSFTDNNVVNGIVVFDISGNIDDGFTVKGYNRSSGAELTNIVYSNIEVNYTEVNGYLDLYKLESVTFTTTVTDAENNEITANHSYDYFSAPLEVTAEKSQHLTDAQNDIIFVIPVLVVCALLVYAVGALYLRNRD